MISPHSPVEIALRGASATLASKDMLSGDVAICCLMVGKSNHANRSLEGSPKRIGRSALVQQIATSQDVVWIVERLSVAPRNAGSFFYGLDQEYSSW